MINFTILDGEPANAGEWEFAVAWRFACKNIKKRRMGVTKCMKNCLKCGIFHTDLRFCEAKSWRFV